MTRREVVTRPPSVVRPPRPHLGGGPGTSLISNILLVTLALALCCSQHQTTRDQWLSMKPQDKRLFVTMLLGHEKVLDRKGGNPRSYTATSDEYVGRIDGLYAQGDPRSIEQIWPDLADAPRKGRRPAASRRASSPGGEARAAVTEVSS